MGTQGSQQAAAILAYCASSILMTVTNKFVLSSYAFHMNCLLLAVQSLVTIFLLETAILFGFINNHRPFNLAEAKKWLPVSVALVAMIFTGSKALQYLSIPLFTVFKNLTIVIIAFGEFAFFGGSKVTGLMMVAFLMMISSSAVAGWSDIMSGGMKDDALTVGILVPYLWMVSNCLSTAFNALVMRNKIKQFKFDDFDTVFYNNLLAIPILLIFSLLTEAGEFRLLHQKYSNDNSGELYGLIFAIMLSGISGFAISFGSSWCLRVTSSTTFSMSGALNKLPISILGFFFSDANVTFGGVFGVVVAFIAGIIYSYAKNEQSKERNTIPIPLHVSLKSSCSSESLYENDEKIMLFDAEKEDLKNATRI